MSTSVSDREEDDDCPRPLAELGHHQDPHHDPGQDGGAQVDYQLALPTPAAVLQVVLASFPAPAMVKPVKTPMA